MMFWGSKNGISSKYQYSSTPTFMAEPWSVYTAKPKSSSSSSSNTVDKVSVFIFDKKQFENYLLHYGIIKSKHSSQDKLFLSEAYSVLKNQVNNLAKFKHPNILQLVEPLEEHSKNFIFVTEYVSGSLFNLFQDQEASSSFGEELLQPNETDSLTIQRGILQVCQALDFIHNKTSSVHLDIQPKSIFVNGNADWKLSGLGHLVKLPQGTNVSDYTIPHYDPRIPSFLYIELDFAAPELVLDETISPKSDFFSLGLLIYYLYYGKSYFSCENSSESYRVQFAKFEKKIATLSWDTVFQRVPPTLRFCLPRLMNRDIYSRYDNIVEFLDNDFFKDPLIQTLLFLDDLPTKTIEEKSIFLKGLVELLPKYPLQLLQKKFLPILISNLDQLCTMKEIPDDCLRINLQVILLIGQNISQLTFQEKISSHILEAPNGEIIMEHATNELIENLHILQTKIKKEVFDKMLLKPLFEYVCEKQENTAVQENLLKQLQIALDTFDFATAKNFLSPLIQKLFTKTTSVTVKNACINCFQLMTMSNFMDAYMIQETLLPLIVSMKTRDARILMKFLEFFPHLYTAIEDKEELVTNSLIPVIFSFSMATTLNATQFRNYCECFNNIVGKVQKRHIQQLQREHSKTQEMESKDFTKIIDTPIVPSRKDTDNEISKSINIPVMQPKQTKPSIANTQTKSILQPRGAPRPNTQKSPISTPTMKPTSSLTENTSGNIASSFNMAKNIPTSKNRTANMNNTRPLDTHTNSGMSTKLNSPPTPPNAQNSSQSIKLPPGFGIALQPSKKA